MKSGCGSADPDEYASTSYAPSIPTSVAASQCVQLRQQPRKNVESAKTNVPYDKSEKSSLKPQENVLLHPINSCPFTFLTAVKRKLALSTNHTTSKKAYDPDQTQSTSQGTMDFVKPLKVPDLKISPKADYSSRESLLSNEEFSKRIEAVQRDGISLKCTDRGPRKLEFSSSGPTSKLGYVNVEPFKIPDVLISKKKDLSRDSSREKENRTKRVKKDDINVLRNQDELQDISIWPKTQRHISRKEIADSIINRRLKNDKILAHSSKESDLKKTKIKNFTTSTIKKDDDKRQKYSNIPSKARRDRILESRNRTSSSESIHMLDKGTRLHDKILIREGYKAMISDVNDRKYKDDSLLVNTSKQSEDQRYKSHSETRLQKNKSNPLKPIDLLTQSKRIVDKQKSSSKTDIKHSSEISEDLSTAATSMASFAKSQSLISEGQPSSPSKTISVEKTSQSNSYRNTVESAQYSESFSQKASSAVVSNTSVVETNISQDNSLSEKLMDPIRISFREDSYMNQPEFADLVTPDMNLMIRSKRRKPYQSREIDGDQLKQTTSKSSQEIEEAQMNQLKAEINLLDSFSESLRHVIDIDRTRISNEEGKKHSISLQSDQRDIGSKKTESESLDTNDDGKIKIQRFTVKVAEVQTQTANDIATQTETMLCQRGISNNLSFRDSIDFNEVFNTSLDSEDRYEGMDRVEDISLPSKMRAMSEISLHETTSSIKTETGTEISISTRDVTCSFNKYLDLEMAQLIKDEKQRYDKIEMLFKSREKTLNDRTKKLVKLEEQKRALRDTGQDSRISSVKKKQRALLLKLQQEKDEMNRLKELHKIASQERKLMLQKQRDMFNPEMSTKNILNKLKRSADSQSPRRLSGPMKGYDIRSNSSISSVVDSDKSQFDRSQLDFKLNVSDITSQKNEQPSRFEVDSSFKQNLHGDNVDKKNTKVEAIKQQKDIAAPKYELKTRNFEEKMPKSDLLKLKSPKYDIDAILKHGTATVSTLRNESQLSFSQDEDNKSISEHIKSESDALIEQFTEIWKTQFPDFAPESLNMLGSPESIEMLREMQKASTKRFDRDMLKKLQQQQAATDNKNAKRKVLKAQKPKTSESTLKSEDSHNQDELGRVTKLFYSKRSKFENSPNSDEGYQNSMLEELDFNESQSSLQALLKHSNLLKERNQQLLQDIADEHNNAENSESPFSHNDEEDNPRIGANTARSQLSLTISHQSSNDSDRSYSRSVVIRSQQDHHQHETTGLKTSKKLEQILKAREATLVSRRNCVEEWIAWHARLRDEESRVARMEQAAYKLVSATAKALAQHNDTTVSSDTSDVEGRIELLTQKLADRRLEMTRLKKEARKQAKQRLRALEANLLNQIKKYDATIREMRKKLEAKRALSKDSDKLAIESRSVSDFKVPEIPIKKIQDIYKSSDLLRSKSDSDVISGKDEKTQNDKFHHVEGDSSRSESTTESKLATSMYTYDEEPESEKSDYSALHMKSNSEEIPTQRSVALDTQEVRRSSSQSSNISEEILSEVYSVKSQATEQPRISHSISERIEVATEPPSKEQTNIDVEQEPGSDETSLIFSRKLDHIQLHNKELNNDIYNLENDLRQLTEMMLNFSKKSDEKKTSDKSTSKDISEELLASESAAHGDHLDEDLQVRLKKILSDVIPETDDLVNSIEEFEIKTKTSELNDRTEKHSELGEKTSLTEEILTHAQSLSDVETNESPLLGDNDENVSEALITTAEEDKENIAPSKTQLERSMLKVVSDDGIENYSVSNKLSAPIQVSSTEEFLPVKKIVDVYTKVDDESQPNLKTEAKHLEGERSSIKEVTLNKVALNAEENGASVHLTLEHKLRESKNRSAGSASLNPNDNDNSFAKTAASENDWTLSDSFDIQRIEDLDSNLIPPTIDLKDSEDEVQDKQDGQNHLSDMEDSTMFIPKGESTNIQETFVLKLDDSSEQHIGIRSEEFNDILEIIERETKNDDDLRRDTAVNHNVPKVDIGIDSPIECEIVVSIKTAEDESESIEEEIESKNDDSVSENILHVGSFNEDDLPQIEIGVKVEVINDGDEESKRESEFSSPEKQDIRLPGVGESSSGEDRGSSDGEQMDNLVEVAEGKLATVEKLTPNEKKLIENQSLLQKPKTHIQVFLDRTFEVIRDPGYEDISEESFEISEILETDLRTGQKTKKRSKIPEKYIIKSKSDEVLRILDDISNKSLSTPKNESRDIHKNNVPYSSIVLGTTIAPPSSPEKLNELDATNAVAFEDILNSLQDVSKDQLEIKPLTEGEYADQKQEDSSKVASESSEAGVSEIDMDSPRDANENSRLDVDALDDDLLSGNSILNQAQSNEVKTEFRTTPMGVTSEKDIEAMIEKLKASLDQPGLEVAELEAKLLQIENLQIELEIKKLEAEEVSYYVREIPNKPPPPYTPPGAVRLVSSHGSPSPPPAVIPTNVEELTSITEKATAFIYKARESGTDVMKLEAPDEICELAKDSNDALKKDRRIYNSFLFDLCKELVAEMYKTEYEKPGPTWTKPNVKTKPTLKLAKNVDEMNEYVSKEVATLFGFKTKLQRENMVMRWSRKRRDRVDELLAKEAQAEEKEWTKFHHDELAVKNELTITILDTLITETTSCIKAAYTNKRKLAESV